MGKFLGGTYMCDARTLLCAERFDQSFPFTIARQNIFVIETLIINTRGLARVFLPEWMTSSK